MTDLSSPRTLSPALPPILPLPRLAPAWSLADADTTPSGAAGMFTDHLRRRRWKVLHTPPRTSPSGHSDGIPPDLVCLDLTSGTAPALHDVPDIAAATATTGTPLLLRGNMEQLAALSIAGGIHPRPLLAGQLFAWWGPERMEEELIRNTPPLPVTRITAGALWVMVETENSAGLAAMPALAGAVTGRDMGDGEAAGEYTGLPLSRLAGGLRHPAGFTRALACAAVNAGITAPDQAGRQDGLLPEQKAGPQGAEPGRTVIVGRFPELARKRPGAIVLEKSPGPGDLPADAACHVLPGAEEAIITASAWSNGTLAGLLRLATESRVTLVGPGTPLTPALHVYGLHRLAGFIIEERERLRGIIAAGGGVSAFRSCGRQVVLSAENAPDI